MSDYDHYWSEVRDEDSTLERERNEADLREWEAEQRQDRLGRVVTDELTETQLYAYLQKQGRRAA